MDEKLRFVHLARSGRFTITELCHDFGISRKTGHKYLHRYEQDGVTGLHELSRCPLRYANLTDAVIEKLILADRRKHRTWGPKKLRDLLLKKHGIERPPSCSTIGAILKRNGMVKTVSTSGFISFEGKNYHVGEHFAGCQLGLHDTGKGLTELHYTNLLLGTLRYEVAKKGSIQYP